METTKKTATKKNKTLKVIGKKYATVSDLVRDTSGPEFAVEFDQYQAARPLVNCMTVIRCVNNVTQGELSDRMGCAQSKVSKIESSADADLNFGDILAFAKSLNQSIHIVFSPEQKNGADHIRFHIACIKHELAGLVKAAGDDHVIGDGVEAFAYKQAQSMMDVVETTLDGLPHRIQRSKPGVSVEAEGKNGRRIPIDLPRISRRVRKTKTFA